MDQELTSDTNVLYPFTWAFGRTCNS